MKVKKTTKLLVLSGAVIGIGCSLASMGYVSAASSSKDATVTVTVNSSLTVTLTTSSITGSLDINNTTTGSTTATVKTNALNGYTMTLADSDDTTDLTNASNSTYKIPTGATIAAGTSAWAVKGGDLTNYSAIPKKSETALTIKANGASSPSTGEATALTFGISTSNTQASGTYNGAVTITTTAK